MKKTIPLPVIADAFEKKDAGGDKKSFISALLDQRRLPALPGTREEMLRTLAELEYGPVPPAPRRLTAEMLDAPASGFDVIVGDVSFISLALIFPALAPLLAEGGHLLMLVKPQFELQPGEIGKGGVVRNEALYAKVRQKMETACAEHGFCVRHWLPSSICGGDGNREFFIHAQR